MSEQRSRSGGGPEVDLERLAAFIDGKLEGDERADVVRLLARSEEAREVVAEAMRLRDEAEGDGEVSRAVPASARDAASLDVVSGDVEGADREPGSDQPTAGRGTPWKVLVPLAAAAALVGILLIPGLRQGGDSFTLELARQVAQPAGELAPPWARSRGFRQTVTAEKQAFRAGYHLAAAALSWTAEQPDETVRQLAVTRRVVEDTGVAAPTLATLDQLEREITDGSPRGVEGAFEEAEAQLSALHRQPWSRLGAWSAAADRAVAGGDATFFRNPRVLGSLEELADAEWPDRVARSLEPVTLVLSADQSPDIDALRPLLMRLLAAAGV